MAAACSTEQRKNMSWDYCTNVQEKTWARSAKKKSEINGAREMSQGLRKSTKYTNYSSRGAGFDSQHPATPVPGDWMPSLDFHGHNVKKKKKEESQVNGKQALQWLAGWGAKSTVLNDRNRKNSKRTKASASLNWKHILKQCSKNKPCTRMKVSIWISHQTSGFVTEAYKVYS